MASNYNGVPRPPVVFCRDGEARVVVRRETYEDLTCERRRCRDEGSKPVRIGLLGRGTVGGAFAELLAERADAVEAATGRRPEISGVLHPRARATSAQILAALRPDRRADRRDRPGARLRARRAARRQARSSPPTSSCSPSTATSSSRVAREAGVQLRFEAAVAGGDPDRPHDPGELRRHRDREGLRDRQRHHQLHPQRDGGDRRRLRRGAGAGAGARLRRGRPERRRQRRRRGGEDGDPRPARLPHPGDARRGLLRGDRGDPARRPRLRQGARPLAEAARRRRTARRRRSASASSPASSTAATRWRRSRARSTRSWSRRRRSPR